MVKGDASMPVLAQTDALDSAAEIVRRRWPIAVELHDPAVVTRTTLNGLAETLRREEIERTRAAACPGFEGNPKTTLSLYCLHCGRAEEGHHS